MNHHKEISVLLECTRGHLFSLFVERRSDVTASHITDKGQPDGYAVYRERTLIECGICRLQGESTFCKIAPGGVEVDVNYKPERT